MTILDMLKRNAHMYPGEAALIELGPEEGRRREITWSEFDERASRIANHLQQIGINKGDKVVHFMRNSINWLEVYFGIIRTGAWVAPLNYRFTASDVQYCTSISEAKVMIFDQEYIEMISAIKPQIPTVKNFYVVGENIPDGWTNIEDAIADSTPDYEPVKINEYDECGLYFTSGTTGKPKPILLTHKNMECAAIAENTHHYQCQQDNFILIPPLYHTGAKMHWFGSLLVGGRATLLRKADPKSIFRAVDQERGTIVWLLVPWAHDILGALDSGELKLDDYDLSCWRLMHIGAQPVPPTLVRRWKKYFPKMQYDNNYGLTESTGPGVVHLGLENSRVEGAIGKAGFNWEARIVDDNGKDVTQGKVGELIVKGCGVMKEYYKNPEQTKTTIKNGWLFTGDMAKMDEEGFIYLVDRKKDVVICGGENVYPVEIEEVLHHHTKIFDVAVIGLPEERLGEIVAAIVDPNPGVNLTEKEVADYCEQQLPRYKRPRVIIIDKVLRNPTGKIEKHRLRDKYSNLNRAS